MKLFDKVLNSVLVTVLVGSITWFLIYEHDKFNISTYEVPEQVIEQPNKIDWAPLIPGVSSIAVFFLRYFLIEKKKKKKNGVPLTDHLIFDTIEDMVENDVKHRSFGSEGRTEAMRVMITIQLDTYASTLRKFIEDNPNFENGTDFRKKLRSCIFKMKDNFHNHLLINMVLYTSTELIYSYRMCYPQHL